jgi:4-diphosphocytidyl-2-C-methyl-D-erythritol kinase
MSGQPTAFSVRSYAKINTHLAVGALRSDGFHEICTIFQSIELHDRLHFSPGGDGCRLSVRGVDLPADDSNLVLRAARLFGERSGRAIDCAILLDKRIPLAAGLGGGSSNAAATLLALNHLTAAALNADEMHDIACALGSDVPYFLLGGRALGRGRGEVLEPLADVPELHLLLLVPHFGVKASQAYRDFDLTLQGENEGSKLPDCRARHHGAEASRWQNDLERGVFARYPVLGALKQRLFDCGADEALMSGSGSVVVGGFRQRERAEKARDRLESSEFDIILTKTISQEHCRRGFSPAFDEA